MTITYSKLCGAEGDILAGEQVGDLAALPSGWDRGVDLRVAEIDHHQYGLAVLDALEGEDVVVRVRHEGAAPEGGMGLVEGDQVLIGLDHSGIGVPVHLGVVEEVDLARIAYLLAAVHEDAAVDESSRHEGGDGAVVAEELAHG